MRVVITDLDESVEREDGIIEIEDAGEDEEAESHAELGDSADPDGDAGDGRDRRHDRRHPQDQHLGGHLNSDGRVQDVET